MMEIEVSATVLDRVPYKQKNQLERRRDRARAQPLQPIRLSRLISAPKAASASGVEGQRVRLRAGALPGCKLHNMSANV